MRGGSARRRPHDDEEESAFVSMTDLTVGFLFIVILLLAYFASRFSDADTVPRRMHDEMIAARDQTITAQAQRIEELLRQIAELERTVVRQTIEIQEKDRKIKALEEELERLRQQEADPLERYSRGSDAARREIILRLVEAVQADINAEGVTGLTVTAQGDALRFQGEGLFASSSAALTGKSQTIIRKLGYHLRRELPCFTVGAASRITDACNAGLALIETVQVEGHADNVGRFDANLVLSSARAASTLGQMVENPGQAGADMLQFLNLLDQPVMAVSGYSFSRPIGPNDTAEGRAANRRIDLRFIMYVPPGQEYVPQTVADIPLIAARLRAATEVPNER